MKKKTRFWKGLIIYVCVFLVIAAAGLVVLWKYLETYQATLPETVVETYISEQEDSYWVNGVKEAALTGQGEFAYAYTEEDAPDVTDAVAKGVTGRRIAAESSEDRETYMLSADGTDICSLTLVPDGKASFGFTYWEVSDARFVTGNARIVSVTVPKNAVVTINGTEVPEKYITNDEAEINCDITEPFDKAPVGAVYTVEGLRGEVEVKVTDESGTELTAETVDGKIIYAPDAESNRLYVIAAADMVVKANDYELGKKYITSFSDELFKGSEDYVGESDLVCYQCSGLASAPEITCEDADGKEVKGVEMLNGGVSFVSDRAGDLEKEQKERLEAFAREYVDFSTNAGDDINANFAAVAQYVLPGSELYTRLSGSIEPLSWVDGATVEYKNMKIGDYVSVSDKAFICSLSYDVINSTGYEDRSVQVVYQLLVVNNGKTWLVANMLADR